MSVLLISTCARCDKPTAQNVCRKCRQGLAARADAAAPGGAGFLSRLARSLRGISQ